jgi:glycosyltransferase involved in cell wall biosynthesis
VELALTRSVRVRVLWLTTGLGRGGAERLVVDTVTRLDHARFDLEVAYVLPWKNALQGELVAAGVPVTCVGRGRPPLDPRWVARLVSLLRRERWDIVHTHAPLPAVVARLAARSGTILLHTEHNTWLRYRRVTRLLNALTFRRNRHVFAVSESVASSITGWLGRNGEDVEVLVQGLPRDGEPVGNGRHGALARLGLDGRRPIVGTVGNLVPKKDHATLLDAVELLAQDGVELEVVIVGGGPLEDELRTRAASSRASVHVLGSRDDVPELLPAFDLFVVSSRFEGLPIAMLEAMAAGVPVVATDVGGVPEVIAGERGGRLVAAASPASLADAIKDLLEDADARSRLSAAARTRAADFDLQHAIDRTAAVYDELMSSC